MAFIELTSPTGKKIFVNTRHIVFFQIGEDVKIKSITRKEAIHKISQALKGCMSGDCVLDAEYALDALLDD